MFSSKDTISSEAGELKGQEEKASGLETGTGLLVIFAC